MKLGKSKMKKEGADSANSQEDLMRQEVEGDEEEQRTPFNEVYVWGGKKNWI
jgi:hypothetical protein